MIFNQLWLLYATSLCKPDSSAWRCSSDGWKDAASTKTTKWSAKRASRLGAGIFLPPSLFPSYSTSHNSSTTANRNVCTCLHLKPGSAGRHCFLWTGCVPFIRSSPGWHNGWIRWYCSHRLFIASIQPDACCVCAFVEQCCSLNCMSLYWIPRQRSYRVNMLRGMHDGTKTTPVRPRRTMWPFICSYYDCLWVKPLLLKYKYVQLNWQIFVIFISLSKYGSKHTCISPISIYVNTHAHRTIGFCTSPLLYAAILQFGPHKHIIMCEWHRANCFI